MALAVVVFAAMFQLTEGTTSTKYLPPATKLWPRLCFYTCLWLCPQGGFSGQPPPGPGRHPPGRENNPRRENPPQTRQTPLPWQGEPPGPGRPPRPGRHPWQGETPRNQADTPPDQADPPRPGRPPPRTRQTPWEEDCSIQSIMSGRYASYWNAFLLLL